MPPAPMVPAIAEYSIIETRFSVTAATSEGMASLSCALAMICQRDPPQTTPTAVTSAGNSRSAFSTRRPKNGTPAAIIGTTAAGMPIVVPVSQ
ncbi:Uncharacterised protein [Klebsiella pneumoniae]|nr:Uncharacterised protein [Klebsiella pneumoniae]